MQLHARKAPLYVYAVFASVCLVQSGFVRDAAAAIRVHGLQAAESETFSFVSQELMQIAKPADEKVTSETIPIEETDISSTELNCLAKNIFYEGKNQSLRGKYAIADVTLNRVENTKFPKSICGVIKEEDQFSWYSPAKLKAAVSKNSAEKSQWEESKEVARRSLQVRNQAVGRDVLFFHAKRVRPKWTHQMTQVARIDDHVFYKYRARR